MTFSVLSKLKMYLTQNFVILPEWMVERGLKCFACNQLGLTTFKIEKSNFGITPSPPKKMGTEENNCGKQ